MEILACTQNVQMILAHAHTILCRLASTKRKHIYFLCCVYEGNSYLKNNANKNIFNCSYSGLNLVIFLLQNFSSCCHIDKQDHILRQLCSLKLSFPLCSLHYLSLLILFTICQHPLLAPHTRHVLYQFVDFATALERLTSQTAQPTPSNNNRFSRRIRTTSMSPYEVHSAVIKYTHHCCIRKNATPRVFLDCILRGH